MREIKASYIYGIVALLLIVVMAGLYRYENIPAGGISMQMYQLDRWTGQMYLYSKHGWVVLYEDRGSE